MIRIPVTRQALLDAIDARSDGWRQRAVVKTKAVVAAGNIASDDAIWSEIKEVFIVLQEHKCAYCEVPMAKTRSGSAEYVAVDYDVEHFRPKNRVSPWPTPRVLARRPGLDYAARVKSGAPQGYLRLAFDPFNYLVSCKVCNSSYKADRFPIAGAPDKRSKQRASLDRNEQPLLLFPLGVDGDEPADSLAFFGALVRPRAAAGHAGLRGRTVIDFFELDTREDLLEGRAQMILWLFPQLDERDHGATTEDRDRAAAFVTAAQQPRFPHAACGRAYVDLYGKDRDAARRCYEAAREYLVRKEPRVFSDLAPPGQ